MHLCGLDLRHAEEWSSGRTDWTWRDLPSIGVPRPLCCSPLHLPTLSFCRDPVPPLCHRPILFSAPIQHHYQTSSRRHFIFGDGPRITPIFHHRTIAPRVGCHRSLKPPRRFQYYPTSWSLALRLHATVPTCPSPFRHAAFFQYYAPRR